MSRPPVHEVVCGVTFQRLDALTPQLAGAYWHRRRTDFPKTETRLALGGVFSISPAGTNVPPIRTWLVSEGGDYILQLQDDRFFLNWRRTETGEEYPGFNPNICGRVIAEFVKFQRFCAEEVSAMPEPISIEMAKINLLREGVHWANWEDLADILPAVRPLLAMSPERLQPNVSIVLTDQTAHGRISVKLESGTDNLTQSRVLKVENTAARSFSGGLQQDFIEANQELHVLFERQISAAVMTKRFNGV